MISKIDSFDPDNEIDRNSLENSKNIILNTIKKINLDLTGYVVLTEAATGHWLYTPLIAALANATKVICFTKDSRHGKTSDIIRNFKNITKYLEMDNSIKVYNKINKKLISQADIVTNSGLLRPINHEFINSMKRTAVISLMWEPWEYIGQDVDVRACWKKGICILGVNESNKILNVMSNAGDVVKKIFEINKIKIKNRKIVIVAENNSAPYIVKTLHSGGASVDCITKTMTNTLRKRFKVIGQDLNDLIVEPFLKSCNVILIDSYPLNRMVIGGTEGLCISKLKKLNPKVKVVVYFGKVDNTALIKSDIACYPEKDPGLGRMNWTADILGPKIIIELNALGLKVGELLAFYRKFGLKQREAELKALEHPFCADFSKEQRKNF